MIVWIKRKKVNKGDGHVIYIDLYQDFETGVQYFGTKDGLTVRLNSNGSPYVGTPLSSE